jgi:hypothetical protein
MECGVSECDHVASINEEALAHWELFKHGGKKSFVNQGSAINVSVFVLLVEGLHLSITFDYYAAV